LKPHDHIADVLAVEPNSRGLCFVVFDEDGKLLDWGGFEARTQKNAACRRRVRMLTLSYQPKHIVLEDGDALGSTRRRRIRELLRALFQDAGDSGCIVVRIARARVREQFYAFKIGSKDDLARAVCSLYPELAPRLPRRRCTWESEHYSLALFEAAALGVTFLDQLKR
tara:strand:- start:14841 stop:15344 length:504 start_codon:yes stop_codon:yes gene_type:complete